MRIRNIFIFLLLLFVALIILVVASISLHKIAFYIVPTDGMKPSMNRGDHIICEGYSLWFHAPRQAEILAFKTDYTPTLPQHEIYIRRIVAVPGDTLTLINGRIYANGNEIASEQLQWPVAYKPDPSFKFLRNNNDTVHVPEDRYFVLGDNIAHSVDSRLYGFIESRAFTSKPLFCFWPPDRIGWIK